MDYVIKSKDECILGIAPVPGIFSKQLTWIFGAPFLRKFYTAYDCKIDHLTNYQTTMRK
jgi:hypothetical protein